MRATPAVELARASILDYRLRLLPDERQLVATVRTGSNRTERATVELSELETLHARWLNEQAGPAARAQALTVGKALYRIALGWSPGARAALEAGPVRLRLRLDKRVAGLPWELLARNGEFLALRAGTQLVRRTRLEQLLGPAAPARRWRVLVACAAHEDGESGMRQELQDILDSDGLRVRIQATTRVEDLQRRLADARAKNRPFDMLHLAAHGAPGGQILLEDLASENGRAVSAEGLADILLAASPLYAVVTTACWGGTPAGLAATLARRGVPEVVGLSEQTHVDDALAFARGFYDALGRAGIAGAVAAGRQALLGQRPESVAWSQVVHYSNVDTRHEQPVHTGPQPTPETAPRHERPSARGSRWIGTVNSGGGDVAMGDINKNGHGERPRTQR